MSFARILVDIEFDIILDVATKLINTSKSNSNLKAKELRVVLGEASIIVYNKTVNRLSIPKSSALAKKLFTEYNAWTSNIAETIINKCNLIVTRDCVLKSESVREIKENLINLLEIPTSDTGTYLKLSILLAIIATILIFSAIILVIMGLK